MPGPVPYPADLHDAGLPDMLSRLVSRRRILGLLGSAGGAVALAACSGSDDSSSETTAAVASATTTASATTATATDSTAATIAADSSVPTTATTGAASTVCEVIPAETAGPFPADGSNGPNVLIDSGVVRRDITASFGPMSGTADGLALTITLAINDSQRCEPLVGAAVYLWHCDAKGRYSLYSEGVTDQNYLRGVQETDATGTVTFETVFPGCYQGRWPHMHFEVYSSLAEATSSAGLISTSQLAFDEQACAFVYSGTGYESSAGNFIGLSLATDGPFSDDGAVHQMAEVNGSEEEGMYGTFQFAV